MNSITAAARCAELAELGLEKRKIIATLTLEDFTGKDIAACFPAGEKAPTFRDDYYDYLVDNCPTKSEAGEWIDAWCEVAGEKAGRNILRNKSAFLRDVDLVLRVKAAVEAA